MATIQIHLGQLPIPLSEWPINYNVQFKSRALPWKYFIINRTGIDTQLKLGGQDGLLFEYASIARLPNGDEAQVFDSGANLIPLSEDYQVDISLLSEKSGMDRVLIKNMPDASPISLTLSSEGESQEIYYAIYVYL